MQRLRAHARTHLPLSRGWLAWRGRSWGPRQREALACKKYQRWAPIRAGGVRGAGRVVLSLSSLCWEGGAAEAADPLPSPDLFVVSVVALYAFAVTILLHPVAAIESFLEVGGGASGPQPRPPPRELSPSPTLFGVGFAAVAPLALEPTPVSGRGQARRADGDPRGRHSRGPARGGLLPCPSVVLGGSRPGGAAAQPLSVWLLHSWSACLTRGVSQCFSWSWPMLRCPCWWR